MIEVTFRIESLDYTDKLDSQLPLVLEALSQSGNINPVLKLACNTPEASSRIVKGILRTMSQDQKQRLATKIVTANRENAAEAARATKGRRARGARRSKRLSAAAGRNVSHREVALDDSRHSRKVTVALFVAAAVVVALVSFLLVRAWDSTSNEPKPSTRVERTDAKADQAVSYDGYSYSIKQTSGKYAFVRTSGDDSNPLTLFELAGEPVGIVLCDGAYCIPENLSDGTWDVMAYAMGDGSVATQLVGSDGKAVTGTGKLKSATLDGTDLVLTDESGNQTRVPLK